MRISFRLLQRMPKILDRYSQYHPSVLTIQKFIDFGTTNASSQKSFLFLRKEIPVRLANIMKEIHLLPEQLLLMPSVQLVEGWYLQSFQDILQFENASPDDAVEAKFIDTLDMIRNRHRTVVETMAQGVLEMKENFGDDNVTLEQRTQYFLDRFYMSRISIRMLIHQHCLLFAKNINPGSGSQHGHVGAIDPECDVMTVAQDAYENARFLCDQYYMMSPECDFSSQCPFDKEDLITMTYVPSHLYHMLFELFKNALRAVVEFHQDKPELPSLKVLLVKGREDLTIKLSDQGGGIRRSEVDLLFNYMYSTAPRPPNPDATATTPLAGYGYGLPLSRLYAKYFNGDLWLNSVDGYGTDATIYLKVFPSEASELLPVYNKTVSMKYERSIPVGDWSDPSQTNSSCSHYLKHFLESQS
ncbi:hypothetical protein CAPTEDRAFT_19207 [Capitella teleta]|uniref:Protein-serine/threonine kinase n=1 Tax=Capitella teleta TaxID=283909 RepID=R7UJU1_CAPTE|nr:hypothetical protein CAPTEDRAFT_19207 [Capitella teleta]|eukprot:ELU03522.1 hypothetical protein CAPTEDRAFT_19207 [Capitella teleta]